MIESPDKFQIENHLVALNGLVQSLILMSHSPELQENHREALDGMGAAIENEFKALWGLLFGGEFPRAGDRKEGQP